MRRRSKKTARLYAEHREAREAFVAEMGVCAGCGQAHPGLAAHEMTPGKNRLRAFGIRALWLAACPTCNCVHFTDAAEWPLARQLWRKLLTDPKHFDLDAVCAVLAPLGHPYPPRAVTSFDVLRAGQLDLIREREGNL